MKQILVVDDDPLMRRSLSVRLGQEGYTAATAATAEEALACVQTNRPDLLLLDIGLPGMDGLEALRALRTQVADIPVIFVTARRRELDQIVGLELGADDYITKPFDLDVLLAHIKAVLRRSTGIAPDRFVGAQNLALGDLTIDRDTHTVSIRAATVDLSPKEFDLLWVFAQNAGRVLSAEELLNQVWGAEWMGEMQTLYVHIRWLREKIEDDPAHPQRLLTVRGVGYKLATA
ncbi:MAG: response regulator transcription factor [Caldilineaceae bacterium]|nr:response regulator transcription factor [Caldilineaceae bacterium]